MDPLSADTIVIVRTTEGAPDDDGVPTTTTTRITVPGCSVLPMTTSPGRADWLGDDTVPTSRAERVATCPAGTVAAVGDRVEVGGVPWRVDCPPVIYQDPLGLLSHVEIYLRRW